MVIPSIVSNRKSGDIRTYKPEDPILDKNLTGSRSTPTALHRGIYRKELPWKPWDVHILPKCAWNWKPSHSQCFLSGRSVWRDHVGKSLPAQCAHTDVYPSAVSVYPGLFHAEAKRECEYLPLCPQLFCCSNCLCQIQWLLSPLNTELYKSCFGLQRFHSCLCLCLKQYKEQGKEPAYEKTSKEKWAGSWNPIHGE